MLSGNQFERTSPEAVGIPSSAVLDFVHAVEDHAHPLDALHGFMLLRHGQVAAEGWWAPYGPSIPHSFYSLSKSFTSTGVGLAVSEGLLSVDDDVLSFFPDDAPADPGENLRSMRVRHLLAMNTGHHEDTTGRVFRGADDNWVRAFLSLPVEHEPGSWFVYNTAATYMLSAIITRLTGETLLDYLRPRLLDPLGIEGAAWETDPRGISVGGSGLHATTEDIARFGQLFLQKGLWAGTQIVPEEWIAEATTAHSDNSNTQSNPDWTAGYGYQFWRNRPTGYRGDGAFGQFCLVLPEQDAVIAINSGVRNMQGILHAVWQHLLPAMEPDALPANSQAHDQLKRKIASLCLPLPDGQSASPIAEGLSGTIFTLDSNEMSFERVSFTFGEGEDAIRITDASGEHSLWLGHGAWLNGTSSLHGSRNQPVAAGGAWISADTYEARICFLEGEFCPVCRFRFTDRLLTFDLDPNVAWGTPETTTITGRMA